MAGQLHTQNTAATDVVLAVRNLKKEFASKKGPAIQALKGVSLEARPGQVTGLVGADGAGKTTLIRTAAGLIVPTAGSVTVLGFDSVIDTIEIQKGELFALLGLSGCGKSTTAHMFGFFCTGDTAE